MHKFYTDELVLASGIVMEIHCHITGICEAACYVIILVQCNLFMIFQVLLFLFVTKTNS